MLSVPGRLEMRPLSPFRLSPLFRFFRFFVAVNLNPSITSIPASERSSAAAQRRSDQQAERLSRVSRGSATSRTAAGPLFLHVHFISSSYELFYLWVVFSPIRFFATAVLDSADPSGFSASFAAWLPPWLLSR